MSPTEFFSKDCHDFNISPSTYDQWVAGHESAHAVVTLHVGATLEYIALNATLDGRTFSRAHTKQTSGRALVGHMITIGAAGPAYDRSVQDALQLPQALVRGVFEKDRESAKNLVDSLPAAKGVKFTDEQFDTLFWNKALGEATTILAQDGIQKKIEELTTKVLGDLKLSRDKIPGDEIRELLGM